MRRAECNPEGRGFNQLGFAAMPERGGVPASRGRRRLSRTLARARWPEYRALLESALAHGYSVAPLEQWVAEGKPVDGRLLILRHDVDQHPGSALRMAQIELQLGLRSTWYFRWRTSEPGVVARLRSRGFSVGFHYETLTRLAIERGISREEDAAELVPEARALLRGEIETFQRLHGPIRSACPHGDSRVPGISNAVLLRGVDWTDYGIDFDGNEVMRGTRLGRWLTDRSSADGRWGDGGRPLTLLAEGVTPILCLTHPNNWVSGGALWADRALAAVLPDALERPVRTRADAPPGT
jgi:hypothetical protein